MSSPNSKHSHLKYRPDIDGLRALAVVPVILFHAGFQTFSGGFVGVDVFFVISGYLITTIILNELEQGKFSIVNFYERRARRILPALFFVMLCCLPFAWLWLLPQDMKSFSQSLVAVTAFASNIFFWRTSGYFDTATELKPMLHTWSLSVEEQYYVFFPLFLMFAWRFGKKLIGISIIVIAIFSLLLAHYLSATKPMASFYLLPTRAWELMVGAMVAFYYTEHNINRHKHTHSQLGGLLGFALICYSIFVYDKQTPFPSFYTLAPTIGAALIIAFNTKHTIIGRLLGSKLFVGIGLISYSAYLWHQPILAFARHRSYEEPTQVLLCILALASFVLAYISWKFIEKPLRNKDRFSRKQVFSISAALSFVFLSFGSVGHLSNGFGVYLNYGKSITSVKALQLLDDANKKSSVFTISNRVDNGDCIFNVENITENVYTKLLSCSEKYGKGVGLIGDSHATNLFNSINHTNRNRLKFVVGITKNGCHLPTIKEGCQYAEFLNFVNKNPQVFSGFVYEKAGWLMLKNRNGDVTPDLLQSFNIHDKFDGIYPNADTIYGVVDYLKKLSAFGPVIWFGPRVEPQFDRRIVYKRGCSHAFQLGQNQYSTYKNLDIFLRDTVSGINGIEYISQIDAYKFDFSSDFMTCDVAYWMDGNHFSPVGEEVFGSRYDLVGHLLTRNIAKPFF